MPIPLDGKREKDRFSENREVNVGATSSGDAVLIVTPHWPIFSLFGISINICKENPVDKSRGYNPSPGTADGNKKADNQDGGADDPGTGTADINVDGKADNLGTSISTVNTDARANNSGKGIGIEDANGKVNNSGKSIRTADADRGADNLGRKMDITDVNERVDNSGIGIGKVNGGVENPGTNIADADGANNPNTNADDGADGQVVVSNKACLSFFSLHKALFIVIFFLN